MKLESRETLLIGNWRDTPDGVVPDKISTRINSLVRDHLEVVATSESGWETLYRDPDDQRLWELSYPESEMHGGGPPRLENISRSTTLTKYGEDLESSETTEIYVYLLDEGTDVWRPVVAEKVGEGVFRLVGSPPDDTEKWEFPTGSVVRVETRKLSGGSALVAVGLANL